MSSLSMYIQISVAQFTIAEPAGPPEADGEETETGRRRFGYFTVIANHRK